jgi:uncharacterized delta-60 repeat protein
LVRTDFSCAAPPGSEFVRDVLVQDWDGRIIVAGYSQANQYTDPSKDPDEDFALARYNPDRGLDTSYGTGGVVVTDFGGDTDDTAHAAVSVGSRKIVVVGDSAGDFALAKYNDDGTLDTTFGVGGKVTTSFDYSATAQSVAVQSDWKIVVAGSTSAPGAGFEFAVVRYDKFGNLDTTFGSGGKVTIGFGSETGDPDSEDRAYGVAIQDDGKIVLGGYSQYDYTTTVFALARLNPDGSLDTNFDGDGTLVTNFGSSVQVANAVAVDSDGKIIAAGYVDNSASGTNRDFALARYHADGSLDTNFGTGGTVTTDFALSGDTGQTMALQPDGKVVVAGWSSPGDTGTDFVAARYNSDGSLDPAFSADGRVGLILRRPRHGNDPTGRRQDPPGWRVELVVCRRYRL